MSSATQVEPSPRNAADGDRVREHTRPDRLRQVDAELRAHVARYRGASPRG